MTPRPTAADLSTWEALVAEACKCAATPERATVTLERLASKAKKAVLPCAPYTPENPFIELRRKCAWFCGLMAATRIKSARELQDALDALPSGDGDPAASWLARRDIGG